MESAARASFTACWNALAAALEAAEREEAAGWETWQLGAESNEAVAPLPLPLPGE